MLMDEKLESHNVVVGAKQVIGTKVTDPLANNGKWEYIILCGPLCNETLTMLLCVSYLVIFPRK